MKTKMSMRKGLLAAGAAAAMAACGGGAELLLVTVVTPLNGQWLDQTAGSSVAVTFVNLDPADYLYKPVLVSDALLLNPSGVCAGTVNGDGNLPLSGSLDNGKLRLTVTETGQTCVDGRFTDLRRLEAVVGSGTTPRVLINDRIDVRLTEGLWVSEGGGALRIKFDNAVGGGSFADSVDNGSTTEVGACDVSPGIASTRLIGTLAGFGVGGLTNPTIAALTEETGGAQRFSQVVFVDGATLTLRTAAGQAVTLKRQKEAVPSTCP